MIALAILSLSLGVLVFIQRSSMEKISRIRDLTTATLLARSKMIDAEQKLFDEGFVEGEQEEKGNFAEEGFKDFKWEVKTSPVELDMDLGSLCGMLPAGDLGPEGNGEDACAGILGGVAGPIEGVLKGITDSIRLVDLRVSWPVDEKYEDSMRVTALVTRPDYKVQ
uniref:Uncharacterized protein n=1 Tax=uncultured marine bacterium MedDCM-OCT-S01-C143 TaxID=743046 RepID=D6PCC3_9BACT|nr:hypothetical protein AnaeK_0715 [uncultured marine bacterium MedDCM-OCT-S01-C143]